MQRRLRDILVGVLCLVVVASTLPAGVGFARADSETGRTAGFRARDVSATATATNETTSDRPTPNHDPYPRIADSVFDGSGRTDSGGQGVVASDTTSTESVTAVVNPTAGGMSRAAAAAREYGEIENRGHGRLLVTVPKQSIVPLSSAAGVQSVLPPRRVRSTGVTSEGLSDINATPTVTGGYDGDNVTVAVIDFAFNASNPEIADNVVATKNFSGRGFDESGEHGTAVAEIVVDTAPNVSLVLVSVDPRLSYVNDAIRWAGSNQSIDIVSMSLGIPGGVPLDGTSSTDRAIDAATRNNTTVFVSAGNAANGRHWNGTYDPQGDSIHNFSDSSEVMTVSGRGDVNIQWNDWETPTTDFDVFLYDTSDTDTLVNSSTNRQNQSYSHPVETVSATGHGVDYLVVEGVNDTAGVELQMFARSDYLTLSPSTDTESVIPPATGPNATAVGAIDYYDDDLEPYSSRGPTIDGRLKPDLTAPDNVSTNAYLLKQGFRFRGTSAAQPHVAGVAALLEDAADQQANVSEIRSALQRGATDLKRSGPDNLTGYGLVDANASIAAILDSETAPTLSDATAVDETDGDGTVGGGDTVFVTVTATDAGGVANVTANASDFGAGNVTLTDPDGDGVYNATFAVDASNAAPNGSYAIPITATDAAGNTNTTTTNALQLNISDRTPPSLSEANAVDLNDSDGHVTALDEIEINVTATDAGSGIRTVTANASAFGAGTVTLTDGDGDDIYNATITVDADQAAPNGTYDVPITATDAALNANATTTNALQLNISDRAAPNVSAFSVRVVDTRTLSIGFDSNETLANVTVTMTDLATGTTVRTLNRSDFGTPDSDTYTNRTTLAAPGRYRVDLVTAADEAGNDGAGGQNATIKLVTETVAVQHLAGPQPEMANLTANVYLTQGSGGLLQVRLRDANGTDLSVTDSIDLADLGVESNTTLAVNVTVRNWTPRLLLGAGRDATWNATAVDANTTTINVTVQPASVQYNESQLNGTSKTWAETDTADFVANASISLAVSDLGAFEAARRDRFDGAVLLTDAQEFGVPRYDTTTNALRLSVAAPHYNVSGGQNRGFFEAFLPAAVLSGWGISDPSSIRVSALGDATEPAAVTETDEGVRLEIPVHYSAGDVVLAPDTTPPAISAATISDATNGDGTVRDGDRVSVSATVTDATSGVASVTVDASPFGAGTVPLSDSDGDGTYTGAFTVDGTGLSDGPSRVTVVATDGAGNTNTANTGTLTFESGDDGGG
ncbi:MAG: S8 family serine peptidase, partial [Haloquadratum sp.]